MAKLETITKGAHLTGIAPNQTVEVIDAVWHGTDVVEVTFKDGLGNPNNEILYRDNEPNLEVASTSAPWSFSASSSFEPTATPKHSYVDRCSPGRGGPAGE